MENEQELEAIASVLYAEDTEIYGLQTEIVWSALHYAQENPQASIEDCINYGYNEWVK